jgi:hypothetical protein
VNILVGLLRRYPGLVDRLVIGERADLPFVLDVAGEAEEFRGYIEGYYRAQYGPGLSSVLSGAYLPVVPNDYWRTRLEWAHEDDGGGPTEWVSHIRGEMQPAGVTLPDDRLQVPRLSLFFRDNGAVRRVSVEYEEDRPLPTGVSVSVVTGCSLPDWGECRGDECRGGCELKRTYDDRDGLFCRCPATA